MTTERNRKTSNVGFGPSQISYWDDLLSNLYNELLEDERQKILQYYRTHGFRHDSLENRNGDLTELIFCDIVNSGMSHVHCYLFF